MSIGGGKSSTSAQESGQTEPWAPQQPYILQGFQEAANQLNAPLRQPYPGSTVADPSQTTLQARQNLLGTAGSSVLPQAAQDYLLNTLGGAFRTGGSSVSGGGTAAPSGGTTTGSAPSMIRGRDRINMLQGLTGRERAEMSRQITDYNNQIRTAQRQARTTASAQPRTTATGSTAFGGGSTLGGPGISKVNPMAGEVNPAASFVNPARDVIAPTQSNAAAGIQNQMADVQNQYLNQDQNAYIDNLTQRISDDIIPQVQSNYAISGRSGSSAGAQEAMARGIASALAPYQFGSAEAEMGRRFTGGETEAQRRYTSGENLAGRQFTAGETQAERAQRAAEAQAARQFEGGADVANRMFLGGESALGREFAGYESALDRGIAEWNSERGRQQQAAALAPSIEAARYTPGETMAQVGSQEDALNQAKLDQQIADYYFTQNQPANNLAQYMGLVTGNYGNTFEGQSAGGSKNVGVTTGK